MAAAGRGRPHDGAPRARLIRANGRWLAAAAALLAGLAALLLAAPSASADPALPPGFQDSIAFGGLEQPTAVRFAPNGMVFVAEKAGIILVYEHLGDETPEVFKDLRTETYDHGDRGLLGLAIDPEFPTKPYVYALFTYDHILGETEPPPKWGEPNHTGDYCPVVPENEADDCLVSGRLVRYKAELSESGGHLHAVASEEKALIPEEWCQQFSSHSIGDLRFGPEGALYASAGDGASFTNADYGQYGEPKNPCGDPPGGYGHALEPETSEGGSFRSQTLRTLDGKIIRIDPETGAAFPGNPLAANPSPNARRIVAEGFRNPFRFTLDPVTGEMYTDNVGSSEIEEIDHFAAPPASVFNSGWPCYEGPEKQFQFKLFKNKICERLYAEPGSTSPPLFYFSHRQSVVPNDECPFEFGSALGGISFYEGEQFPSQYKGALFITDTVRGCVYVMFPGANGRPDPSTTVRFMRESRIYPAVDIQEGPEGALYYVDLFGDEEYGDGAVHKITYNPGAPTARLKATPPYGDYNAEGKFEVQVEAGESSDPQNETLTYEWDLDGNGSFETSGGTAGKKQSLVFTQKEEEERKEHGESLNRVVAVRVKDGEGNSSVARVTIYPGDTPPAPRIDKPEPSLKWGVGDKIMLHGSAVDLEEGEGEHKEIFTPLSYYWSTRILHCPTGPTACHAHPLQIFAGTRSGELIAPEHDYPSYIEITLRVADKRGLAASKTIKLEPRTVGLSIESSPPGIELTAGLAQAAAPFSLTAIEGSHVLLSAPETAQIGGKAYTFKDWSDGGARIHTILANSATRVVASYTTPESAPPPPGEQHPSGVPKTILRRHPPAKTRSRTAKFTFVASIARATFRCRLDRRAWISCRSPKLYRGLKRGKHLFAVTATASGVSDPTPARFRWKILGAGAR